MKISEETLYTIQDSRIDGNRLYLPPDLERKNYLAVNKVLESIGLKWNRKEKCHIAEHDVDELVAAILTSGEWVDEKKQNQFYETPKEVADKMLSIMSRDKNNHVRILEPSAGNGALLKEISSYFPNARLEFCELSEERAKQCLDLNLPNTTQVGTDFLQYFPAIKYDIVIMNPPFSKQQDIDHVLHAYNHCIGRDGIILSIIPEGTFFRSNTKTKDFWITISEAYDFDCDKLPEGSFKKSGTMVNTRIIYVRK